MINLTITQENIFQNYCGPTVYDISEPDTRFPRPQENSHNITTLLLTQLLGSPRRQTET